MRILTLLIFFYYKSILNTRHVQGYFFNEIFFDFPGKRIYTTDFNAQNIIEIPTELNIYKKLVPDGKLRRPQGIHVDSFGGLLVADSRNNCIRHVTPEGDLVATIRAIGAENIEYPVNVAGLSGGHVGFLDGHGKFHVV